MSWDVRVWRGPDLTAPAFPGRVRQWLFGRYLPGFRSRWEIALVKFEGLFLPDDPPDLLRAARRLVRRLNGGVRP